MLIDTDKLPVKYVRFGTVGKLRDMLTTEKFEVGQLFELTPDNSMEGQEARYVEEATLYGNEQHAPGAIVRDHYTRAQLETVAFLAHDWAHKRRGTLKGEQYNSTDGFIGEIDAVITWAEHLDATCAEYWQREEADFYLTCEHFINRITAFMQTSQEYPALNVIKRDAIGALFDSFTPSAREEIYAKIQPEDPAGEYPALKKELEILHGALDGVEWDSDAWEDVRGFFRRCGYPEFESPYEEEDTSNDITPIVVTAEFRAKSCVMCLAELADLSDYRPGHLIQIVPEGAQCGYNQSRECRFEAEKAGTI